MNDSPDRYQHMSQGRTPVADALDRVLAGLPPSLAELELMAALERLRRRPPPSPPKKIDT